MQTVKESYAATKKGHVIIGGKKNYFRSSWECNMAAYYESLKKDGHIQDWLYEKEEFWFLAIKRGVRSYKPDFKIIKTDGSFYFVEVKGYMDAKSRTKLKRMKKYHPFVKMVVVDNEAYREIEKLAHFIHGWGKLN